MVAHRGNLNYQDCRRTLTAGFDREELDLLRDLGADSMPMSSGSSGSVPGTDLLTRQTKIFGSEATGQQQRVRFRVVITSAFILANEFWTYQGLQWIGSSEVRHRAQKRAAQFLTPYLDGLMCKRLSRTCLALYRLEFERTGAADANRVGDRFLSPECRLLHGYVKECVVESIRTGIQTSFYTCDYTTKPSMTCGPMLKHLTHGMKNLEEKMQAEAEQEEAQRLQLAYPLPAVREGRGLTAEQREARRRLCRLWTSANHAVMHGFCLMSLQLMTGREVLRTHIFWRIMMKRVLWGVFEEMRRNAEKLADSFELQTTAAVEDIELPPAGTQAADTRATSFYEDYLHRGIAEPLASMNLYVYAMHVSAVPLQEAGKFDHGEFDFSEHYVKAKTHVQVLHAAPRIPYLHGISMPTKQKDPDMWAAVHIALLRKHCCEDENVCGQASAVRHIHIFPGKSRVRVVFPGNDARIVRDSTGVLAEWKATEARVQCLADRADVVDVTALRQYKVPGTVESCDVLESLLKMFTEPNRPKTRRTWKQGRRKRTVCSTVPLVSERILGNIFDYVGHLTTEDGEAVLLGNSPEHFDTCVLHRPDLAAAKRCSYGWHNEQLTAAEYVATISREISANLDFMAEARRRPRPGVLHPTATDEKEDVGLQGEFVNVEDVDDIQDPDADDVDQDTSLRPDIQYKPILHVASNDLFDMVHRRNVGSGRASASTKRSEEFLRQYGGKYLDMKESRPCARAPDTDVQRRATFNVVAGLKAQKFLQESRKEKDEKLMDASKDEFLPGNASLLEVPVSMAPETEVLVLSPADMALRLLQQRLPTRQADGTYQISPDQYKACVLAIAPLQKLWVKAGEHDLQHCFGARGRLRELLALVTPDMIARIFLHGPGGSGKTYMLTRVMLPVYEHFLPKASKGIAAQNSAARLITVLNHSLMEIFGMEVPRAPTYERMDEQSRQRKQQIDRRGLQIFDRFLPQTILFRGSHRFKAGDPLAAILENMRKEGFHPLTPELKDLIRKQLFRPRANDPRLDSNFVMRDSDGRQVGPTGFFANGVFSAINWDQVARLQQITVYESARSSFGVHAFQNTMDGRPRQFVRHFPPALGRSFQRRFGQCLQSVAEVLKSFLFAKGQVIYYAQAVDLVHQKEYFADQSVLRECLSITNMASKTCNLMAFAPLHVGLRVKITKKLMAPELVQECPAEIVAIHVHPEERYGIPGCPPGLSQPPLGHPCWTEGICRLDYLPASITIRVEDRGDDYTGEGLPGIWHLDPCEDEFRLRIRRRGEIYLDVTRVQYPLAPWNLPMLPDGSDIDFDVFEHGPPQYIADFLKRLEAGLLSSVFYNCVVLKVSSCS
ncbi:unnamed protein product [Cladocopium goreaui]|uniref:ATP-dependent DNA helicase n=1 Tax=Cladocopium goreaui TaxID=2562237 RepID=A0A9P1G3M1_9DINO|nr:unnamed protein product [Cladocopium goreaui]